MLLNWFPHFSWFDSIKHVLEVFRYELHSMTEDQVQCCINFVLIFNILNFHVYFNCKDSFFFM